MERGARRAGAEDALREEARLALRREAGLQAEADSAREQASLLREALREGEAAVGAARAGRGDLKARPVRRLVTTVRLLSRESDAIFALEKASAQSNL